MDATGGWNAAPELFILPLMKITESGGDVNVSRPLTGVNVPITLPRSVALLRTIVIGVLGMPVRLIVWLLVPAAAPLKTSAKNLLLGRSLVTSVLIDPVLFGVTFIICAPGFTLSWNGLTM